MTGQVEICNQALAAIGTRSTISSLTEDSPEARQCSMQYESTLKQLLRGAHWSFARTFKALALLKAVPGTPEATTTSTSWDSTYPPPPWAYSYAYPADCLMLRYVVKQEDQGVGGVPIFPVMGLNQAYVGSPVKWVKALDGNQVVIATNAQSPLACYTKFVSNPDLWDASFIQAMIAALAGQMAIPLTGSNDIRQNKFKEANQILMEARAADANEGTVVYDMLPDWIKARGVSNVYAGADTPASEAWGPLFS
jgi:hypothetical protein